MTTQGSPGLENGHNQEHEIRLIDLWRVIVRRKRVLVGIWGLVFLFGLGYLVIIEPVYEYKAVVQIGQIGKKGPIEAAKNKAIVQIGQIGKKGPIEAAKKLVQRLQAEYRIMETQHHFPRIKAIKVESDNIISLTVQDRTNSGAGNYLKQTVNRLISEHEVVYNEQKVISVAENTKRRERYESLKRLIGMLRKQVGEVSAHIDMLKRKNPSEAGILTLGMGNLLSKIWELEEILTNLQLELTDPPSQQTKLIGKPTGSNNPIKPKPAIVIPLGIVWGLILGIFSAFIAEFVSNTKKKMALAGKV